MTAAKVALADCSGANAVTDAIRLGALEADQWDAVPGLLRVTGKAPHHCARAAGLEGGSASYCAFVFPFRSLAASETFSGLLERFAECPAVPELTTAGPAVNHPDSYELKVFQLGAETVSLALKDKGGIAQTYIFVRIEAAGE
ncbi:hypothetical protein [Leisingera sp. S232]|uniref:hypothetical protein n=1 Tax=Leisingera sp. S232 TaxID=3415132 RepID=UPI003C7ECCFF